MEKLYILYILFTFAIGIVGSHDPMTRELSTSPFPTNKVDFNKKLNNMRKLTTEEFVARANVVHHNKYNYSETVYVNSATPLKIICPIHGMFEQVANTHLSGCGCNKCKGDKIHSLKNKGVEEFINDARLVHGDKYGYDKVEYKTNKDKVIITCPLHGDFTQTPNAHLRGSGCSKCADEKTGDRCRMTLEDFLTRAHKVHGEFYNYSLVNKESFADSYTPVQIICPKHGGFEQTPHDHLSGRGCYWCGKESMAQKQALKRDEVVARCNEIFNNKYDYSLFNEYHSKKDVIQVICPKHGAWEVSVNNHLYNQSGCPRCKRSLGEERIAKFLEECNVEFVEQYRVRNESLFAINMYMMIDFFLPQYNMAIEYNGIQHYKENPMFDCRTLEQQQDRDSAVRVYCKGHHIKLVEIPYTEHDKIESILKRELKIKRR